MSMSDEQFDVWTEYAQYRDELRARDTAQREALARVEVELAEAVKLLRKKQEYLESPYPYGAYSYGLHGTAKAALIEVRDFLARHAQAEQQEASEGDWPNGANVKLKWICDETELTGWARLEAGILYSVHSGVPLKTGCWKIVEDRSGGVAASRQEALGDGETKA